MVALVALVPVVALVVGGAEALPRETAEPQRFLPAQIRQRPTADGFLVPHYYMKECSQLAAVAGMP